MSDNQEPVAWMHPDEGLSYENHYVGSVPLYTHPVSSEPVFQVGFGWLKHDHVENGTLLYLHPAPVVSSEPFAWRCWNMPDDRWEITTEHKRLPAGEPLYLHPSRHLSDEEILDMWIDIGTCETDFDHILEFARAVLEKSNG